MTAALVAQAVRNVLSDDARSYTLLKVTRWPFAWECVLLGIDGLERQLMIHDGSSRTVADTVREALETMS
jgi:hypothetical protein